MRCVAVLGAVLALGLVVLTVVQVVAPQRDGPLALSQILAPYLFLLLVPFLVFVLTPGPPGRLLRWGLAAGGARLRRPIRAGLGAVPGVRAGRRGHQPAHRRGLAGTWSWASPRTRPWSTRLRASDAAVVGLVELTPHHARAIAADPELAARYQTIELRPKDGSLGIGILSTLPPIGEPSVTGDPPILVQELDAGDGRTVTVVVAHPLPGQIEATAGETIPIGYDSTSRDRHLDQVRGIVDPILRSGAPLLLIGDFNVVDREPGYGELAAGLIDAQRAVGLGPGHTWRPGRLEWLPFGLLRIDYLFSANGVTPVSAGPDCTPTRQRPLPPGGGRGAALTGARRRAARIAPCEPVHAFSREGRYDTHAMFDQYGDFKRQLPDRDPSETQDWTDSLESIARDAGPERAQFILYRLLKRARQLDIGLPPLTQTRYINTISPEQEPPFPGDEQMELRIRRMVRWNAVAMVLRGNNRSPGLGGHLATYASAASLYEVGFNHFFRGKDAEGMGDQVFMQGHAAPGRLRARLPRGPPERGEPGQLPARGHPGRRACPATRIRA